MKIEISKEYVKMNTEYGRFKIEERTIILEEDVPYLFKPIISMDLHENEKSFIIGNENEFIRYGVKIKNE